MFKNRSKKLWLSLIAVITTLFIPIRSFADLTDVVTSIPVTIIKVIVLGGLAVTATFGLLDISQGIFSWASNPNLAGGVTTNEFVMQAWGVIRDFSNLFFILIIVGIGVATALRIKQYEVKKTLPRLIAIAILINFSPVICGVMIDTANIIMNFFFSAGQGGFSDMITIAGQAGDEASSAMNLLGSPSTISNGPYLTRLIVTVIMNLMGSFVLLLMSGLFIVRNIALWLLVILSPLAFLSAVSPKSGLFKKWSTQFISWTFIGVTASFFVYLSQLLIEVGPSKMMHYPDMESGAFGTSLMSGLIMNFIPIITLFMGYQAAMSSGATGARIITSRANKIKNWGLGKAKSKAGERITSLRKSAQKSIGEGSKRMIPQGVRDRMERWSIAGADTTGSRARRIGTGIIASAQRDIGKVLGPKRNMKTDQIITEAEKELEGLNIPAIINKIKSTSNVETRLGYLLKVIKDNKFDDITDQVKYGNNAINLENGDFAPEINRAFEVGKEKDILASIPHAAVGRIPIPAGDTQAQAFGQTISQIKPNRVKQLTSRAINGDVDVDTGGGVREIIQVMDFIVQNWNQSHVAALLQERGDEISRPMEQSIRRQATAAGVGAIPLGWLEAPDGGNNRALANYIRDRGSGYFQFQPGE